MKNNYVYDTNIENTRVQSTENINQNQNPYINQPMNINQLNNNGAINQQTQQNKTGFNNGDFIKGALLGAAVTFILTNKGTQESLMKAASKGSELFQAGMEELKERFEDAKAAAEANQV